METPTPVNELGAKGIGESGTIGSTPAVQNAEIDAVASPDLVWDITPSVPGGGVYAGKRAILPRSRSERRLGEGRLHLIEPGERITALSGDTRLHTQPRFLHALRDEGRSQAEHWLEDNLRRRNARSAVDLSQLLAA